MKIKTKIFVEPSLFDSEENYSVLLKNGNTRLTGKVKVNYAAERIEADFDRELQPLEKFSFLKEIFYCFCVSTRRKYKRENLYNVSDFLYVDKHSNNSNKIRLIEELMAYDLSFYDEGKKKETVLYDVKDSYDKILKGISEGKKEIELHVFTPYSSYNEVVKYEKILSSYIKSIGLKGYIFSRREDGGVFNPYYNYWSYLTVYKYKA